MPLLCLFYIPLLSADWSLALGQNQRFFELNDLSAGVYELVLGASRHKRFVKIE